MEIELKYRLRDKRDADRIFADFEVRKYAESRQPEAVPMYSVYYDTEDLDLRRGKVAFRVRRAGDDHEATLKWNGASGQGMHRREEMNIRITEEQSLAPEIGIFEQSEIYPMLEELTGGKKLVPVLEMFFERKILRLDMGTSISELSCDVGRIMAGGKEAPILELEIELFSGEEGDIVRLGSHLADRYGMEPEDVSKYQRGLDLL